MMGTREKLVGGDEYDALTRARQFYSCRPGQVQSVKAKFWRRIRKAARQAMLRDAKCGEEVTR
jgi:hypothetical protein